MNTYLVNYDISSPERFPKVARTCEDMGLVGRFLVFLSACGRGRDKTQVTDTDHGAVCLGGAYHTGIGMKC